MKGRNKYGQLKLSFGMIFSIILIIFFLVFAFFGIKKFLDIQETISIEQFKSDLQEDIKQGWISGGHISTKKTYSLPKEITGVCFEDDEDENMYFVPREFGDKFINYINWEKTLDKEINSEAKNGRLCFENINGKVNIFLKKDFGENFVTIIKK